MQRYVKHVNIEWKSGKRIKLQQNCKEKGSDNERYWAVADKHLKCLIMCAVNS